MKSQLDSYHATHHLEGLFLVTLLDRIVYKMHTNKLYTFFLLIPMMVMFFINMINHTLFSNQLVQRAFIQDYPALWFTGIGIPVLSILLSKYINILSNVQVEILKFSKQDRTFHAFKRFKHILASILILCGSSKINKSWVVSQLNDQVITWTTYNGNLNIKFFPQTIEKFNIIGFFYWFVCIICWYLFITLILLFIYSVIHFILNFNKIKDLNNAINYPFFQDQIQLYIQYSSKIVNVFIFYYVTLQINDIIIEGFSTFLHHQNRIILLIISVIILSIYILITTVIMFRASYDSYEKKSLSKHFFVSEIKFDIFLIFIPTITLTIYYIFMSIVLKNESYEFKSSLTFIIFLMILLIIIINQVEKKKRSLHLKLLIKEINNLSIYASTIDDSYQKMRHYKHDITNILLGLRTYIDQKRYEELETYFYKEIVGQSPIINPHYQLLSQIVHITNLPLKGLIISKLNYLNTYNISLDLEIIDNPLKLPISDTQLCRIVGILIDNAIEAALSSDEKKVLFSMSTEDNQFEITIGNSYNFSPDLDKIFELNYSSKGPHRGTGLHSIKTILKSINATDLVTLITKDLFLQKIIINLDNELLLHKSIE